jgi:CheY-like chemotaxis protein
MTKLKRARILLAEDNLADAWLIEEALHRRAIDYVLEHYSNAEEAVNAICRCGKDGHPVPDLMLLDYNLPRGNGGDVLTAAAENPNLARVPKALLSSFLRPEELDRAIKLGISCFIPKSAGLEELLTTVGDKVTELLESKQEFSAPT